MKLLTIATVISSLWCVGCASRSEEAYARLIDLVGISNNQSVRRVEFLKTSGIDPYYLAKLEVSGHTVDRVPELFDSPGDLLPISDRFVSVDRDIEWWRPQDLRDPKIWTRKRAQSPSYTEIVAGRDGDAVVVYVAWLKTVNF